MKIICISTSIIPAPTAHSMQLMKVCHALGQLGHSVELIVPGMAGVTWETLSKHYGLPLSFPIRYLQSIPAFKRYDFSLAALRYAHSNKPDLIYTWLLPAGVMGLLTGIPTVLELHDRITGHVAPWLFKRFLASNTKKRLAVITDALAKKFELQYPSYRGKLDMVIAPNGVELGQYINLPPASVARKQLGFPEKPTVVYTGGFYAGRGIDLLYGLARQNPGIQFIWAGGTPESAGEWRLKIDAEGLRNVHVIGFIDNDKLPLYQAAADILVMPFSTVIAGSSGGNSGEICSPMKMFDYLAAGRAIMASDLPVLHEVLNDSNALLVPPDDAAAWHLALNRLVSQQSLRDSLGQQSRKDAGRYTWIKREMAILKGFSG